MIPICEHKDCFLPSEVECRLPALDVDDFEKEDITYYCLDHAIEEGFCYICGVYIVPGNESREIPDLCEHCEDELQAEIGECDEEWLGIV